MYKMYNAYINEDKKYKNNKITINLRKLPQREFPYIGAPLL